MKYNYTVKFTNSKGKVSVKNFICNSIEELYDMCFHVYGSCYASNCELIKVTAVKKSPKK